MLLNQTLLQDTQKFFADSHLDVKIYSISPASQWNLATAITLVMVSPLIDILYWKLDEKSILFFFSTAK